MKRINFLYYIVLIALWPLVDRMIGIGQRISNFFLLLMPLYVCFFIFSQNIFYGINKRKALKATFVSCFQCETTECTLWLDRIHGELAVLCLFNPFKVQYIPVEKIQNAYAKVFYTKKNPELVSCVALVLDIKGRKYNISMLTRGKYCSGYPEDGMPAFILMDIKKITDGILEAREKTMPNRYYNTFQG